MTEEIEGLPENVSLNFDEMFTMIYNLSRLIARYYFALLENEIPDELACRLTVEYQNRLLNMAPKE
jgi:predicted transcriptional regulator